MNEVSVSTGGCSGYDVILSGPVSGVPDYVQRFAVAYVSVRQKDYCGSGTLPKVFNPATLPDGRSNEWYMRQCLAAIFDSPGATVVMLPGWMESKGARAENALAVCLGMKVEELK